MARIRIQQLLMMAGLAGVTACGGGGSSGNSGSGSVNTPSSAASSSISVSSQSLASSSQAIANKKPTLSISFPRQNAKLNETSITVQGTASDDKGISRIEVNGVEASFQRMEPEGSVLKSTRQLKTGATIVGSTTLSEVNNVAVTWTAIIPLPFGQTDINVVVTDSDGDASENTDKQIKLSNYRVPLGLIKDSANHRFISSEMYPEVFSVDMTSLTMTRLPDSRYEAGISLSADSSKIYSAIVEEGFLKVYSSKIATGLISVEANYDLQFDEDVYQWISLQDGAISLDSTFYFALMNYLSTDSSVGMETKILKINLDNGQVSVLRENVNGDTAYKNLEQIEYLDNYLIGSVIYYSPIVTTTREFIKIDADTGVQESFIDQLFFDFFALNDSRDYLYLLTDDNLAKIKIADKSITYTPFHKQDDMLEFAQKTAVIVDEEQNRLVVSDSGLGQLISVDIISGERSFLTENGIGEGPKLVWPDQLVVTSDNQFAYVLDARLAATEMLLKIDLSTGNREMISDLSIYAGDHPTALVLDEAHNRVFVAFGLTIGVVDLVTGQHEIIASQAVGLGPIINGIGDMIYDAQADRLLVSSTDQELVIAIDLETYKRSILFDTSFGTGPALTPIASLALDEQNNLLYASTLKYGDMTTIIAIDMETGNREVLLESCDGHTVDYKYDANLELNPLTNTLVMLANNEIFQYDLIQKTCTVFPVSAFDIAYLSDSTLLGVMGHGLYQINPINGERVIISQ